MMILVLSLCGAGGAYAAENIVFRDDVAVIDLNGDSIDERIERRENSTQGMSSFLISADKNGKGVSLGTLNGRKVMAGNHYRHGVRNLLLFQDAGNDFSYDVYGWNPTALGYVLIETPGAR